MGELDMAGCDELTIKASECAAHIYHCAQESMAAEFKSFCFRQLNQVIHFERAVWVSYSTNFDIKIYNGDYFNFELRPAEKSDFERRLIAAPCFVNNFRFGGVGCYPGDIAEQKSWQASDFYQSYGLSLGLEHLLILGFDNVELGCKEVVFLFRSQLERFYERQAFDILTFLMPHIIAAAQVSHAAVNQYQIIRKNSCQAICGTDGKIIEIDHDFSQMIPSRFLDKNTIAIDFVECCMNDTVEVEGVSFNAKLVGDKTIVVASRQYDLLSVLTRTEKKVAVLMSRGVPTKSISDLLGSALRTVEKHQASIYKKLGTKNKAGTVGLLGGYKG